MPWWGYLAIVVVTALVGEGAGIWHYRREAQSAREVAALHKTAAGDYKRERDESRDEGKACEASSAEALRGKDILHAEAMAAAERLHRTELAAHQRVEADLRARIKRAQEKIRETATADSAGAGLDERGRELDRMLAGEDVPADDPAAPGGGDRPAPL